jgi:hypothetical protein
MMTCDFCKESVSELWIYKHPDIRTLAAGELMTIPAGAVSVCDDCQRLFEAHEVQALTKRVREAKKINDCKQLAYLRTYYAALMKKVEQPARHVAEHV